MKKNTVLLFSSALLITAAVLFCAADCSQKNTATARSAQAWSNEDGADFADIPDFEQAFVPVYEKAVPEFAGKKTEFKRPFRVFRKKKRVRRGKVRRNIFDRAPLKRI